MKRMWLVEETKLHSLCEQDLPARRKLNKLQETQLLT
jgi:hypothetical protein